MRGVLQVTRWSTWFGGVLILLAAFLIGIDVVLRKFFATSIGGADELAGYALAIATAWSLAAALLARTHIRIDSLYALLPLKLRLLLDFLGLALFIGFFGLITRHGWNVLLQSWNSGSRSQSALQIPTVIPQAMWIVGLALFLIIGALLFAHALGLVLRGRSGEATRAISTRSAQEDVAEEVRDVKARRSLEADTR
ncbi:MAG TPA: TRAP transporter small permease subunit [Burkholderiales bacterium]|nr:TRAP transporter small permease subunit [Burkholderiales bacterium]